MPSHQKTDRRRRKIWEFFFWHAGGAPKIFRPIIHFRTRPGTPQKNLAITPYVCSFYSGFYLVRTQTSIWDIKSKLSQNIQKNDRNIIRLRFHCSERSAIKFKLTFQFLISYLDNRTLGQITDKKGQTLCLKSILRARRRNKFFGWCDEKHE